MSSKLVSLVVVDVVVAVLTSNSHNQVHGHRTGSSHSGVEEYPREKTKAQPKMVHAYIVADAIHAPARKN